ncbi:hypothetical protein [Tabrizicola sp.]|uniref:hypothetical protein n=1 Tax=Tabrizicola sp. TaxID=2005166 RepID=UPI0025CC718F|nr:hypothetical protein [Tabrizicola sp.]
MGRGVQKISSHSRERRLFGGAVCLVPGPAIGGEVPQGISAVMNVATLIGTILFAQVFGYSGMRKSGLRFSASITRPSGIEIRMMFLSSIILI